MSHTFLWHDYETFGIDTRRDRPAQFAAIRTDDQLNEIGEPLMLYCQPSTDYLPDPASCLITGITPQIAWQRGVSEREFAQRIEQEMAQPGTISVGYNSIRFDDEVTRFLFWRNLMDPYAREWQNQCGRWDLMDVVRMVFALRPDGINWPTKEDGTHSFKLEDLTRANGLAHEAAHDALSDVRATIALARLVRQHQPKLFDFALALHKKDRVAAELHLPAVAANARPFLHVSGMFGAERGCLAVMWPLASHPTNKNEIIAWDLSQDPSELATLSAEQLRLRMFTRSADLPDMSALWVAVFARQPEPGAPTDPEQDLYAGFVSNGDRHRLNELRAMGAAQLAQAKTSFDDPRLTELLWRYRARNFADSLSPEEQERWEAHRSACLIDGAGGARTAEKLLAQIDEISEAADERGQDILGELYDYASEIAPER